MDQLLLFTAEETRRESEPRNKMPAEIIEENARLGIKFFYDIYEAADLLGTDYKHVSSLILTCKIDCLKIRTTYRIPWRGLLDYLTDYERINDIEENYYQWIRFQETAHLFRLSRNRKGA